MLAIAIALSLPLWTASLTTPVNVFNEDGRDPRHPQIQFGLQGRAYAPIGILTTKGEVSKLENGAMVRGHMVGTATLIAPCFALASAHQVFGDRPTDFEELIFRSVSQDGKSTIDTEAWPVAWGKTRKFADDWALVKLVRCEGRRLGWIDIGDKKLGELSATSFESAGFPADMDQNRLWRDPACKVHSFDISLGLLSTDCAARSGSSGSPLLTRNARGRLELVGLIIQETSPKSEVLRRFDQQHRNLAIYVPGVAQTLRDAMKANAR